MLRVAVPWSLSNYIPIGGYRPIYRPLFDHVPANISLCSWDNVKLYNCFERSQNNRTSLERAVSEEQGKLQAEPDNSFMQSPGCSFSAANRVLTKILPGDVEFHHSVPFSSQTRPFVFYSDDISTLVSFVENSEAGRIDRQHYKNLFTDRLCLGVFFNNSLASENFQRHFHDSAIDGKLHYLPTGPDGGTAGSDENPRPLNLDCPRFLFINSAHQNPMGFIERGGHIVLRFWKNFIMQGRCGRLVMRCVRPAAATLERLEVDVGFVEAELGKSILWLEDYCPDYELDRLMAASDFYLLPSKTAHLGSVRKAMNAGAIAVITDGCARGDDMLDSSNSIRVSSSADEWPGAFGNEGDSSGLMPSVDPATSLEFLITRGVVRLLDSPLLAHSMRDASLAVARKASANLIDPVKFWEKINDVCQDISPGSKRNLSKGSGDLSMALANCLMSKADFERVFDGPTQPLRIVNTGQGVVNRIGGHVMLTYGNEKMRTEDWSVVNQYLDSRAPRVRIARTMADLDGRYIYGPVAMNTEGPDFAMVAKRAISERLMPYPKLYGAFSWGYQISKRMFGKVFSTLRSKTKTGRQAGHKSLKLVREDILGYNIIELSGHYYAAPQHAGAFSIAKALESRKPFHLNAVSIEAIERLIRQNPVDTRIRAYRLAAKIPFLISFAKVIKTLVKRVLKGRSDRGISE